MSTELREQSHQIPWPEGIESQSLNSLLELNKKGASLRFLVSQYLVDEVEELLTKCDDPQTEGFQRLVEDLKEVFAFVENGGDEEVARIIDELFVLGRRIKLSETLKFLEEKFVSLHSFAEYDFDKPSDLFEDLAETIARVEILKEDPRGFALVDHLAEKQPHLLQSHPDYQRGILG